MYNYTKNTIDIDCGSYNDKLDLKSSPNFMRFNDISGDSIKFFNISKIINDNYIINLEKNINKFIKDNNCKVINIKKIDNYLILIYNN